MRISLLVLLFLTAFVENVPGAPSDLAARIGPLVKRHSGEVAVAIKRGTCDSRRALAIARARAPMKAEHLLLEFSAAGSCSLAGDASSSKIATR